MHGRSLSTLASVTLAAAALAAIPAAVDASTFCFRSGTLKTCRTPGKKYDKICTTVYLGNGFTVTKCHRVRHR